MACIVGVLMICREVGGGGVGGVGGFVWASEGGLCRLDQKSCATLPARQIKRGKGKVRRKRRRRRLRDGREEGREYDCSWWRCVCWTLGQMDLGKRCRLISRAASGNLPTEAAPPPLVIPVIPNMGRQHPSELALRKGPRPSKPEPSPEYLSLSHFHFLPIHSLCKIAVVSPSRVLYWWDSAEQSWTGSSWIRPYFNFPGSINPGPRFFLLPRYAALIPTPSWNWKPEPGTPAFDLRSAPRYLHVGMHGSPRV